MNPDPWQIAMTSQIDARREAERAQRQAKLHRAAVTRRRKAKRGGKK